MFSTLFELSLSKIFTVLRRKANLKTSLHHLGPEIFIPAQGTPVSYTHLDVYKRQSLWWVILLASKYTKHKCQLIFT